MAADADGQWADTRGRRRARLRRVDAPTISTSGFNRQGLDNRNLHDDEHRAPGASATTTRACPLE
ncbi:MAG: hypothetical protein MZU95_14700 [Desulfomicrobium escambiense]|nr:hypothetical protein [Desulfomicrobium escambiense]